MTTPARMGNFGSSMGPSLAVAGDTMHAAWKGIRGDDAIWYSSISFADANAWDSAQWAPQKAIVDHGTDTVPGLAAHNGVIHTAFKDARSNAIYTSGLNYQTFYPPQLVRGVGTSYAPGMISVAGELQLVWKGINPDNRVWTTHAPDGLAWAAQDWLPFATTKLDAQIAATPERVIVVWNGDGNNGWYDLQWSWSLPARPFKWSTLQPVLPGGAPTNRPVALVVDPQLPRRFWLVWRGDGADDGLHYALLDQPYEKWDYKGVLPIYPGTRIGLAAYKGAIYAAWDEPSDQSLWWRQMPELRA